MNFYEIGTVYQETGNTLTNSDGFEYPETEAVDGYFVMATDLTEEDITKLSDYIITENLPNQKFAGRDDTVYLKFDSRDTWLSLGYVETEGE